jgi:DcaP outer membrane protein
MVSNKFKKLLLASPLLVAASAANAGYDIKISDDDKISFGGYIKVDARYVDGELAHSQYWAGSALAKGNGADGAFDGTSKSQLNLNVNETRFNMKYTHGEVMGFIEMDFYGKATEGGGNEIISNSSNPRLRHAFIKYKDVVVGQTWSTFMNTSAIPETADFAGPAMGIVFIRQGQVRYTMGNFEVSLENPYTWGGDATSDDIPDVIAKYNFKGDWGNVSVAGITRQLNVDSDNADTAIGYSVAGRIKTFGKDDLRFQVHGGEVGRYVGVTAALDVADGEAEETTAYLVAYRHFWTEDLRSTVAYANSEADTLGWESTQWSVNLFKNLTKQLAVGVEVGNFSRDDQDADSNYAQVTMKYVL